MTNQEKEKMNSIMYDRDQRYGDQYLTVLNMNQSTAIYGAMYNRMADIYLKGRGYIGIFIGLVERDMLTISGMLQDGYAEIHIFVTDKKTLDHEGDITRLDAIKEIADDIHDLYMTVCTKIYLHFYGKIGKDLRTLTMHYIKQVITNEKILKKFKCIMDPRSGVVRFHPNAKPVTYSKPHPHPVVRYTLDSDYNINISMGLEYPPYPGIPNKSYFPHGLLTSSYQHSFPEVFKNDIIRNFRHYYASQFNMENASDDEVWRFIKEELRVWQ